MGPGQIGFTAVIDAALQTDVDFFLLAGDLFDHNRVKAPCQQFVSEQLARLSCPVVMITGNHDCMADYSIYHQYDPREAGSHVIFLDEEAGSTHVLEDMGVSIWGRGIVDHHPGHKPLATAPRHDTEGWSLGMTHGFYINRGMQAFSSLITPEEIEQSGFDYLALGHVHVFSVMEHGATKAVYSGSPNPGQGTSEMSAALVQLEPETGVSIDKLALLPGSS